MNRRLQFAAISLLLAFTHALAQTGAQPAQPTLKQRAAMLKAWMEASNKALHSYEWVETTAVSKDGEQKSSTQKRCFYDPEGNLTKVPMGDSSQSESGGLPGILPPGRLLKKIGEHEKKEMEDYLKNAEALVHSYVPPNPALIQQATDAGNLSIDMIDPGKQIRLVFKNYLKTGDQMGFDIELATNRLLGVHIASYIDDPSDAVTLDVVMGVLADGTIYAQKSTLDAQAKNLTVTVENSDYVKAGG